jgi:glyoxylase-like metal-dependent hydrolase (beta-lactamase superfamily II)
MGSQKVSSGVWMVGSDDLSGSGDCMVYAVKTGTQEYCLIDAGTQYAEKILENIQQTPLKGLTLKALILTHSHFDHIGAAHQFVEKFPNLETYTHSWDVGAIEGHPGTEQLTAADWYGMPLVPIKVTHVIQNDTAIINCEQAKLHILHTPGHTPGSMVVYYTDSEGKKILFGQDIHGPFMPEFNSNIEDWRASMKEVLALRADILCEGHFGVFKGKDAVKQFINGQLRAHRH